MAMRDNQTHGGTEGDGPSFTTKWDTFVLGLDNGHHILLLNPKQIYVSVSLFSRKSQFKGMIILSHEGVCWCIF